MSKESGGSDRFSSNLAAALAYAARGWCIYATTWRTIRHMSVSKPGVGRDAVTMCCGALIECGLVVRTRFDS
jgi:hypothetical protein